MDDMDPELCAQVYVDWEYRKKWDSYVLGLYSLWLFVWEKWEAITSCLCPVYTHIQISIQWLMQVIRLRVYTGVWTIHGQCPTEMYLKINHVTDHGNIIM